MIYFQNEHMVIRDLEPSDAQPLADAENAQGWHTDIAKFETRLRDRAEGRCVALAATWDGVICGYINIYPECQQGPERFHGLPEIVDFAVLEKYRARGVGTALMDAAEAVAARYADTVYLGVGLHSGYGSAQRMYVKRGYIPDGSGVWYNGRVWDQYAPCVNDDDLNLYLSKRLR